MTYGEGFSNQRTKEQRAVLTVEEFRTRVELYLANLDYRGRIRTPDIDDLELLLHRDDGSECDIDYAVDVVRVWIDGLYVDGSIDLCGEELFIELGVIEE